MSEKRDCFKNFDIGSKVCLESCSLIKECSKFSNLSKSQKLLVKYKSGEINFKKLNSEWVKIIKKNPVKNGHARINIPQAEFRMPKIPKLTPAQERRIAYYHK